MGSLEPEPKPDVGRGLLALLLAGGEGQAGVHRHPAHDRRRGAAGEAAVGLLRNVVEREAVDDARRRRLGEMNRALAVRELLFNGRRAVGPKAGTAVAEIGR